MSNIDLHNHVIPETVIRAIKDTPEKFGTRIVEKDGKRYFDNHGHVAELIPEFYDVEAKLEWMDRVRLDIAAISIGPPVFFYNLDPDAGLDAARLANDGIAEMVAANPDRLRGMAHLPMQDPDAAIVELERAVREYGFKAVEIATSIEGVPLADPRFRPVLKTIEQLGCFVFTHPYQCLAHGGMDRYYMHNFVGFPLDTTLMLAHLMFSGAMDDLKSLRILCAHGGGFLPYQIGRFDHGYGVRSEPKENTGARPLEHFKRFYFDALTHNPQSARHLINVAGADHVCIGTDHPFDMGPVEPVTAIEAIPGLTAEEREWVCSRTARRLLGEE